MAACAQTSKAFWSVSIRCCCSEARKARREEQGQQAWPVARGRDGRGGGVGRGDRVRPGQMAGQGGSVGGVPESEEDIVIVTGSLRHLRERHASEVPGLIVVIIVIIRVAVVMVCRIKAAGHRR